MNPDLANLTSTSAVAALTLAIVALLKPSIATTRYLRAVPVWLYAVVVAIALTFLANRLLFTLPGNLAQLALQGAVSALAGMGIRSAAANLTKPAHESVQAAGPDDDVDDPPDNPFDLARTVALPIVLALALATAGGGTGGCAGLGAVAHPQTPVQQLTAKRLEWAAVKLALSHVLDSRDVDPRVRDAIAQAQQAGNAAFAAYEKSVLAGETPADAEVKAFDAAIAALLKLNEDLGGGEPPGPLGAAAGAAP